ncbi:MAG: acetate kinase [Bacteroidetes bacterium]|jgi:acetate kinase|nr:acetate kinase [Bacteroidota bacterium]MBT5527645.1 acetate kinase [Cytophagia bacterium]MBT3421595.1 acetate kinase [Bacteroidota bacterium]MBT3799956.1 acetate kinase [Bacteroidota bacterium]MBT3934439.1 acetate kinase [Bacteroidota bacterium]
MKILVLNCGSSSIKYQFFNMQTEEVLAKGVVEKIGLNGSFLKNKRFDGDKLLLEGEILDHQIGIEYIVGVLISEKHGCIKSLEEIDAVGHRVVHGAEKFKASIRITMEMIEKVEQCSDLAPLHNPPNLKGIYAIDELLPNVMQVAVFDTAFHQTMEPHAYMYAIPYSLYTKYGIRRYGFHGTSHRYVSHRCGEILGQDVKDLKIISCHLGNGASIAAIQGGVSVDTSMGLTPVEGLIMGTRCGDLDLGAFTYIMDKEEIGLSAANTLINKHSGMLGVSGISSDMRDIENAVEEGNERAKLAMDMYQYRVKKYIGAYAAAMNGVDVIIFTGGIGENDINTRGAICLGLEFLGTSLDMDKHSELRGKEAIISSDDSKVKLMVIPTNEELVIARDTMEIKKNSIQ